MRLAAIFFAALAGTSEAKPPYSLPEWETSVDPDLVAAVAKDRGVKIAAVIWKWGLFGGESLRYTKAVDGVLMRTLPLGTSNRLGRGIILRAFKIGANGGAWWPARPYRWNIEAQGWPYAMVSPPERADVPKELIGRIYDQPITLSKGVGDSDLLALVDFFFGALITSQTRPPVVFGQRSSDDGIPEEAGPFFMDDGKPFFRNLASIERTSEMSAPWRKSVSARTSDFVLTLSQGGDGCELFIVRKIGEKFRFVSAVGVDF